MKTKYTVQVGGQTFTRTTERQYTHLVVCGRTKLDLLLRELDEHFRIMLKRLPEYRESRAKLSSAIECGDDSYMMKFVRWVPADSTLLEQAGKWLADYDRWIADLERKIADREVNRLEAIERNEDPTLFEAGWCGREDLARKLASKESKRHRNVQVIELLPEHAREVKSRAKKAPEVPRANLGINGPF